MLSFKRYIEEMYKKLVASELLKPGREGRGQTLIDKIKDGDPFLLNSGKTVVIRKDDQQLKDIQTALDNKDNTALNSFRFTGTDGQEYKLSDFAKSPEFGGKGKGSGTKAEDFALSEFRKELTAVFEKENVPFIYLKIGKRIEQVAAIFSTPGTPKADFHMVDTKEKEVFWISHKKGSRANDFQQYGGMSELKSLNSRDMQNFVDDIMKELKALNSPGKLPAKTAFCRPVKDRKIIDRTLFGKDFRSSSASGRQNIDVLFQGPMKLKRLGGHKDSVLYTITSNHTVYHGEIPRGDYECYYYVRPEAAKNQFNVKGGRFFIVAKLTAVKNRNTKVI